MAASGPITFVGFYHGGRNSEEVYSPFWVILHTALKVNPECMKRNVYMYIHHINLQFHQLCINITSTRPALWIIHEHMIGRCLLQTWWGMRAEYQECRIDTFLYDIKKANVVCKLSSCLWKVTKYTSFVRTPEVWMHSFFFVSNIKRFYMQYMYKQCLEWSINM